MKIRKLFKKAAALALAADLNYFVTYIKIQR